ncbi:hypothetical protein ECO55CA74_02095 [Escherichia coli O55:H7 str. RM12579]|nr:hypothetical protein ECO55CA74_02095 [Escherichia coli O55:H7 str. RM12579]EHV44611.1 hypothetical protein ECDEC5D_0714 [Escherichia coli DEC5D]EHV45224.1 hypothetical protein ECDEC5C_0410 [Escherichia coli DEC5C]
MQVIISSVYLYANWHSISFFADILLRSATLRLKKHQQWFRSHAVYKKK